jgi:adenylate kinase family enzyme
VDARATAQLAHRVAHLRLDKRVHHDCGTSAGLLNRDQQVVDVLHARVANLLERLVRELRLERQHEPLRRLSRRVRDDVQLDGNAVVRMSAHAREASGGRTVSNVSRMPDSITTAEIVSRPPRRVCLISTASGCGKSTTGHALAARMNVPYYELDALHHGPNWEPCPADELRARVEPIVRGESWVVDGTYRGKLGDLVPEAADLVVWLDLPMRVWLPRLVRRTARRVLRKEELWNGNRERWRDVLHPTNSVVVYALRNFRRTRRTLETELARFRVARLRSPAEVETFLESAVPVS